LVTHLHINRNMEDNENTEIIRTERWCLQTYRHVYTKERKLRLLGLKDGVFRHIDTYIQRKGN